MALSITLERIEGEIFFVSSWLEEHEPVRHVFKWKAEGPTVLVPDESLGIPLVAHNLGGMLRVSVPRPPHDRVQLYISGAATADLVERVPVPQPKVRAHVRVRWSSGWQKYTMRDGWRSI